MPNVLQYVGQALFYGVMAAVIGFFATTPRFRHFPEDQAMIRLAFNHSGAPVSACRKLTREEMAALPPNMRRPTSCPRGRVPLVIELDMDGAPVYRAVEKPTGLFGDGPSRIYRKFAVPIGRHHIEIRLRDSRRESGFDYLRSADVALGPRDSHVIDFQAEAGGFVIRH